MSTPVLIVDDSLTVRMELIEAFERAGFRALGSATVSEARAVLGREPVPVVVLDVLLPDGDGVEFLREIRAHPACGGAVVLMLSTESEVKDRIRGLTTGADEYVGKPYDIDYVLARTRELLRARTAGGDGSGAVLVIDDSSTFRDSLCKALAGEGYAVAAAETGEEGLRLAAHQRPAAILVDGMLPGIDGVTVVRRIRLDAALRGVPCVMLTASDDRGAELRALDAGADAFVRKGPDMAVVLARLAAVLRQAAPGRESSDGASLLGPKKVLAVDDSVTYLQELAHALRGDGYDVIPARSGEEALDLLPVQPVDCVLLDLVMPGLGGHETCRRIKAAPGVRDVPVVILTALDDRDAMIEGLSAGADDYIPKSGDFEVLKARVRAQIRRKHFEDEHRRVREELLRHELEAAEARAARELAETRAALVEELERKNRELEAFSYSVSHDLRAPLRSIDGFSQALLEDYAATLDPTAQHYLSRVRAGAQRMGELIDDLLQLSRVGRADLRRALVDLTALAQTVAADLGRREPERRVTVAIEEGLSAVADAGLLRVALENLLGNAWKFTRTQPLARVEVGVRPDHGGLVHFVRDNGVGFDMRYADKLFRPFQRLHSDADFPGTGIGLATVYRIVERHGGRVWAESASGAGATFYFRIPAPAEGDRP